MERIGGLAKLRWVVPLTFQHQMLAGWRMRTTAFGLVGRGVILIKFAIAFPPFSVAAVAMDVSRDLVVKQKFTNAVAVAALAAGRQFGRDDATITALAQGFSNAAPNSTSGTSSQNHSDFSAYGFAATEWRAPTHGSQGRQLLDAFDHHRYIYAIAFQVTVGAGRTILQNFVPPPNECLGNQRYLSLPISRLDSISDGLQIEFGLE